MSPVRHCQQVDQDREKWWSGAKLKPSSVPLFSIPHFPSHTKEHSLMVVLAGGWWHAEWGVLTTHLPPPPAVYSLVTPPRPRDTRAPLGSPQCFLYSYSNSSLAPGEILILHNFFPAQLSTEENVCIQWKWKWLTALTAGCRYEVWGSRFNFPRHKLDKWTYWHCNIFSAAQGSHCYCCGLHYKWGLAGRALAAARAPHIFPNKCIFLIVRHCYEICLNLDFLSFCPEIIASIIQLTV